MHFLELSIVWLSIDDTLLGLDVVFDWYQISSDFLLLSGLFIATSDDLSPVPDPLPVGVLDRPLRLLDRGLLLLHL